MSPPRDQSHAGTESANQSLRQLRAILSAGGGSIQTAETPAAAERTPAPPTPLKPLRPLGAEDGAERVLTADDLLDLVTPPDAGDTTRAEATPSSSRALVPLRAPARQLRQPTTADDPVVVRPRRMRDRRVRRQTGVAPFVRPSMRRNRRQRRRDYRKLGFIELTQERARLRHRILPRTVLGVSAMMLSLGVGAAFAGASLYAYYDYRLTENETRVDEFAKGFENNFAAAISEVARARDNALESISQSSALIQDWVDATNAIVELPQKTAGGVFTVRTLDVAGKPVLGSAFVVSSDQTTSLLLTSHELVQAATAQPGPKVTIERLGGEQIPVEVWAWDPQLDLALLKVGRGNLPALTWAPDADRAQALGKRVYVVGGVGAAGATAAQVMVIDQSQQGLRLDSPVEADFRGGPVVDASGQVLGVATSAYRPLGFPTVSRPYVPMITMACKAGERGVVICPDSVTAGTPTANPNAPGTAGGN
jgi:hypothetical protein